MMPSLMNGAMSPKKTMQQPQASNVPQNQQVLYLRYYSN